MAQLTIYDSQGNEYRPSGGGRSNEKIKNLFFGGVRLYAEVGSQTELTVFFRARESSVGRAEQYYAVYRAPSSGQYLQQFKSELKRLVEDQYGMTIQTTSDDVEVFNRLGQTSGSVPGTKFEHSIIKTLLNGGQKLRFGVPDVNSALALFNTYLSGPARRVVIADNTNIDELSTCDLAIEVGSYRGLEPLGKTKRMMDQGRKHQQGKFIQQKMNTIKQEVNEIRRHTNSSDEDIRRRLKTELSILENPKPKRSEKGGLLGTFRGLDRPQQLGVAIIGSVVVLAMLLLVIANVTAVFGSGISFLSPLVFVGDDDPTEDALESIYIVGDGANEVPLFDDDGEKFDVVNVTLSDGEMIVAGNSSEDDVSATFTSDESNSSPSETASVDNGSFKILLTDIEEGAGELTVEVGSGNDTPEFTFDLRVTIDDDSSDAEDEIDSSDDDSEDEEETESSDESIEDETDSSDDGSEDEEETNGDSTEDEEESTDDTDGNDSE